MDPDEPITSVAQFVLVLGRWQAFAKRAAGGRKGRGAKWLSGLAEVDRSYSALAKMLTGEQRPRSDVLDAILRAWDVPEAHFRSIMDAREKLVFPTHSKRQSGWSYPRKRCGYSIRRIEVRLRMDVAEPVSTETRTIVALRAIDEIGNVVRFPRFGSQELPLTSSLAVIGPERLEQYERSMPRRWESVIKLPSRLPKGKDHTYTIERRIDGPMRPFCVLAPETACRELSVEVKFDLANRPTWIRRVNGENSSDVDDAFHLYPPDDQLVELDEFGWARVTFENLTTHLRYGIQWSYPDTH